MSSKQSATVIGAGPAGLSAAIGLLRAGYDVTLLDQRARWSGRVCGSFLNSEAVSQLKWLGVWSDIQDQNPVSVPVVKVSGFERFTRICVPSHQSDAVGFPRKDLEESLLHAVHRRGGKIFMGIRVLRLRQEGGEWIAETNTGAGLRSQLVVNADGRYSLTEPRTFLKSVEGWYGWNASFENVDQKPGEMSLHVYPGGYVGVLTFSNQVTNVCGLVHRDLNEPLLWDSVFSTALDKNNFFSKTLEGARRISDWQGVGPLPFTLHQRLSRGSLLAGDAAAVGDPFMGEGIGRALGAGPMIHQALLETRLHHGGHDDLLKWYRLMWNRHYASRLRIGYFMRRAMKGSKTFPAMTRLLINHAWLLRWATNRFHVGYNGPRSETITENLV